MADHAPWCDGNGMLDCPDCGGEGGYHDCGEDCCMCLEPEANRECHTCVGAGFFRCPECAEVERCADAMGDAAEGVMAALGDE
jgi:hypothetical protein